MNNKLILFCLLIAPVSFASQSAPAAGAGAAAQLQASQVDVKAIQEKQDQNRKLLAALVAEMHLKCGSVEQRKKSLEDAKVARATDANEGWLLRYSIPTAKDEWIDEQTIVKKSSDSFVTIITHYSLDASSKLSDEHASSKLSDEQGNKFQSLINCKQALTLYKAKDEEELALMFMTLMNNRMLGIFNVLAINGEWGILRFLIDNHYIKEIKA